MEDRVVPEYKKVSASGGIINSKMRKHIEIRSTTTSGPMFQTTVGGVTYSGDMQGPHWTLGTLTSPNRPPARSPSTIDIANLRALASTRALSNISTPDYQGGVTLGEFAETLRYLRNPVASAQELARAVERRIKHIGRYDKGAKSSALITEKLGGVYLSIQFGLKPLLSEITGILETLRDASHIRPPRETARAKEERVFKDSWTTSETFSGITYNAAYEYVETVTVKCGFLYAQNAHVDGADHFGFNIRDFPKAIWQVTPLSFVADWFGNVAAFIGALTPNADAKILASWTTTIVSKKLTRKVSGYSFPGYGTYRDGTGEDSVEFVSYEREPWVDPPSLAVKNLDWLRDDIGKVSSLYALVATRLAGIYAPMDARTNRGPYKPGKALPPHRWYG